MIQETEEINSTYTDCKVATKVDIRNVLNHDNIGKYVEIIGTLVEKDRLPYVVRAQGEFVCKSSDKIDTCLDCAYLDKNCGDFKVTVRNDAVLGFIKAKKTKIASMLKEVAGIPFDCKRVRFNKFTKNEIVYQCVIVPCIGNGAIDLGNDEKMDNMHEISISAVLFGELDAHENKDYIMRGATQVDPEDSSLKFVIDSVEAVADDISSFKLNESDKNILKMYQCDDTVEAIVANNKAIFKEKRHNYHRIFGYEKMEYFVHMLFHSVAAFTFDDKTHDRGWLDGAIIGDSRTGKSEIFKHEIRRSGIGYIASSSNMSAPGILGGMSQSSIKGGQYQVKWGLLPRLDRRLVAFDEAHCPNGIRMWPLLNDARSSGLSKISKIGAAERSTRARVRKAFISNPPDGKTTGHYYYPVEMAKEIFSTPECMARLDFLYVPRTEDCTFKHGDDTEEVMSYYFATGADKLLLRHVYSREAHQVTFTKEAEEYLTLQAEEIGSKTDNVKIPLIQKNEARFTFARGAAAQAASRFSTDETGEIIVVHKADCEVWINTLISHYESDSNGYMKYSEIQAKKIKFNNSEDFYNVTSSVKEMVLNCQSLVPYVLQEQEISYSHLINNWPVDPFQMKKIISCLSINDLIESKGAKGVFHKTRRGIVVFKYLSQLATILWTKEIRDDCKPWFDKLSGV